MKDKLEGKILNTRLKLDDLFEEWEAVGDDNIDKLFDEVFKLFKQVTQDVRKDERKRIYDLAKGLVLEPTNLEEQIEDFKKLLKELD